MSANFFSYIVECLTRSVAWNRNCVFERPEEGKENEVKKIWLINVSLYFNFRSIFLVYLFHFHFALVLVFMCLNRRGEGVRETKRLCEPNHESHGMGTSMGGRRALLNERIEIFSYTLFFLFCFFIRIIHTFIFFSIFPIFHWFSRDWYTSHVTNNFHFFKIFCESIFLWTGKMLKFITVMLFSFITCNILFTSMINNITPNFEPNSWINSNRNQGFFLFSFLLIKGEEINAIKF